MSLTFEGRQVDAGDAADWNIIERQVSHHSDLRRPIVTFDGAQVGAAAVDRHAEFGASSRVGEFDANMTARDGFLQRLARFFVQPRFDRMIAFAEKLHQLAHSTLLVDLAMAPMLLLLAPVGVIRAPRSTHLDPARLCVLGQTDFHGRRIRYQDSSSPWVRGGQRRPPRFCDATATPIPALSSSAVPATT